jgi:hypothetical protein
MAKIDVKYEKVGRVKLRATTTAKLAYTINNYGYDWTHSSAAWYRRSILKRLRKQQKDCCCYCRRAINYNKGAYELDHIIDKGSLKKKYGRFCFELRNLALACKDCNNNKGVKSVLFKSLGPEAPYPVDKTAFNWVHPHLHEYSAHISIHTGWVYEAVDSCPLGLQVIQNCKLDELNAKELMNRRVHVMGAATFREAILRVSSYETEAGLDSLCREFGSRLAKKWKRGEAEIDGAIRALVA